MNSVKLRKLTKESNNNLQFMCKTHLAIAIKLKILKNVFANKVLKLKFLIRHVSEAHFQNK